VASPLRIDQAHIVFVMVVECKDRLGRRPICAVQPAIAAGFVLVLVLVVDLSFEDEDRFAEHEDDLRMS